MNTTKQTKQHGFTLVEMLVVMGMLAFVMAAIYSLYYTHQRTAFVQEEVVEVQQNLRIGADSISRDIKMAGFLIPLITSTTQYMTPIAASGNGTGVLQPLPAPDNINSDTITLYTMSTTASFATISVPRIGLGAFTVKSSSMIDPFVSGSSTSGDKVVIIGQESRSWRSGYAGGSCTGGTNPNILFVSAKNSSPPTLTLGVNTGSDQLCSYDTGDMIVKLDSSITTTLPSTIRYCLGPDTATGCGGGVTTCPTGQLCLMRIVNGNADVIAQNMAGLQFRYLTDFGTEVDTPSALCSVRAVRVTLTGQTVSTKVLSNNQQKERQVETIIEIRNRATAPCGS